MKSRQRGLSLIGMILVMILLGLALLVGFKMVGPYKEYYALKRILAKVASESDASEFDMRNSYERMAIVDGVDEAVKPKDLLIRREGGVVVISVDYVRKAPLVGNVSLLFDFKASSRPERK
ncbi:MAG: DUF4845 domain-containing protein [Azoarcus sp.]|jgi:hypothetical protein|nr:DUF4845 domain-containing protein [Azoarcus sp.]